MKSLPDSLGDRIRQKRESKGISQGDLASKIGISQKSLSQIETGKTFPRRSTIIAIAEALDSNENYFLMTGPVLIKDKPKSVATEELRRMIVRPEEFDSLYLASRLAEQFVNAPEEMRALSLMALFDRLELLQPYQGELADVAATLVPRKQLK